MDNLSSLIAISTPKKSPMSSKSLENLKQFSNELSSIDTYTSSSQETSPLKSNINYTTDEQISTRHCTLSRPNNNSLAHNIAKEKQIQPNHYDIPVSPTLKQKVRQRLFSLVNNIDGYLPPQPQLKMCGCLCQCHEEERSIAAIGGERYCVDTPNDHRYSTGNKLCLCSTIKSDVYKDIVNGHTYNMKYALEFISGLKEKIIALEEELSLTKEDCATKITLMRKEHDRQLRSRCKEMEEKVESSQTAIISDSQGYQQLQFLQGQFNEVQHQHKSYISDVEEVLQNLKLERKKLDEATLSHVTSKNKYKIRSSMEENGNNEIRKLQVENERLKSEIAELKRQLAADASNLCNERFEAQINEYKKAVKFLKSVIRSDGRDLWS